MELFFIIIGVIAALILGVAAIVFFWGVVAVIATAIGALAVGVVRGLMLRLATMFSRTEKVK